MYHFDLVWNGDMNFVGKTPSNQEILIDASKEVGGKGLGPLPMELLIVGLAGCTAIDVLSILNKMRKNVTSFRIEIDAERANEHPKVWTEVNLKYILKGDNLDEKSVQTAIELSQTKYCSASAMFKRSGAKVNYLYLIEK